MSKYSCVILSLVGLVQSASAQVLCDGAYENPSKSYSLWPNGIVPYTLPSGEPDAGHRWWAMRTWEECADVYFVPRTTEENYLDIRVSTGNNSFVGMVGGAQVVNITYYDWISDRRVILHELGHALGLRHEQQRSDREVYVIPDRNTNPSQFSVVNDPVEEQTDYDYLTVMHYTQCAYSVCGTAACGSDLENCRTMIADDPAYQNYLGSAPTRTALDAEVLRLKYGFTDPDCNGNYDKDAREIDLGAALDCNSNSIPDECELVDNDCNSNGIPDDCEPQDDCNSNQILDICELVGNDCNGNSVPDDCDPYDDCNNNQIQDICELDCNGNLIPDDCDIAEETSSDCDQDSIPDECEAACCLPSGTCINKKTAAACSQLGGNWSPGGFCHNCFPNQSTNCGGQSE